MVLLRRTRRRGNANAAPYSAGIFMKRRLMRL